MIWDEWRLDIEKEKCYLIARKVKNYQSKHCLDMLSKRKFNFTNWEIYREKVIDCWAHDEWCIIIFVTFVGLLNEGDEILEVNGIDMRGKNINDVSDLLVCIRFSYLVKWYNQKCWTAE